MNSSALRAAFIDLVAGGPWVQVPFSPDVCFSRGEHPRIAVDAESSVNARCIASVHRKGECPCVSICHSMGLNATDLRDQELSCSLIQIQISCSEQTMSSSGMKTVCWLKEHWSKSSKAGENIWTQEIARAWNRSNRAAGWNIKFWAMRERIGKGCWCMLAAS